MLPIVNSVYRSGYIKDGINSFAHAWVEVEIGNKKYIADPAQFPGELKDFGSPQIRNYEWHQFIKIIPIKYKT